MFNLNDVGPDKDSVQLLDVANLKCWSVSGCLSRTRDLPIFEYNMAIVKVSDDHAVSKSLTHTSQYPCHVQHLDASQR